MTRAKRIENCQQAIQNLEAAIATIKADPDPETPEEALAAEQQKLAKLTGGSR